jgi:hypothetical protein
MTTELSGIFHHRERVRCRDLYHACPAPNFQLSINLPPICQAKMKSSAILSSVMAVGVLSAATTSQSLCNKYTAALFGSNTEANQQLLLHKVVNTAVIGNYTPGAMNAVPGILTPGTYNGEQVNLLQYFNGALESSNRGGNCGVAINFLDGGGAAPLMNDKAANCHDCEQLYVSIASIRNLNVHADAADENSMLLTHLYKFFAALLGCSIFGNTVKPYNGFNGMYEVHKFMALDAAEVGYFIQQVGQHKFALMATRSSC